VETHAANADLLLQTDRARWGHVVGVHELDQAGTEAEAMNSAVWGLHLFRLLQTQGSLVEVQTPVDIRDNDQKVHCVFGVLKSHSASSQYGVGCATVLAGVCRKAVSGSARADPAG